MYSGSFLEQELNDINIIKAINKFLSKIARLLTNKFIMVKSNNF